MRPDTFSPNIPSIAKAIDRYIEARSAEQSGSKEKMDPRLQSTIEGIFSRCVAEGEFKQVRPIWLNKISNE